VGPHGRISLRPEDFEEGERLNGWVFFIKNVPLEPYRTAPEGVQKGFENLHGSFFRLGGCETQVYLRILVYLVIYDSG